MEEKQVFFNSLVSRYSETLYWHVRSIVGSHDDADDLMQEIFLKAWKALPDFRGGSEIFTWLWRIATNESINFLRRAKVRAALSFTSIDSDTERLVDSESYFNPDAALSKLQKAIAALPPKQRSVFTMRYFEELSYEEISSITGTSVGALKASYHHAFEKVKQYLIDHD